MNPSRLRRAHLAKKERRWRSAAAGITIAAAAGSQCHSAVTAPSGPAPLTVMLAQAVVATTIKTPDIAGIQHHAARKPTVRAAAATPEIC